MSKRKIVSFADSEINGPFLIEDWAGNVCFNEKEFTSYEAAWSFLYETFPNGDEDRTFDDYFVVKK